MGVLNHTFQRIWISGSLLLGQGEAVKTLRRGLRYCDRQLSSIDPAGVNQLTFLDLTVILKGWFERVFACGDAYALTLDGWHGETKAECHCVSMKRP